MLASFLSGKTTVAWLAVEGDQATDRQPRQRRLCMSGSYPWLSLGSCFNKPKSREEMREIPYSTVKSTKVPGEKKTSGVQCAWLHTGYPVYIFHPDAQLVQLSNWHSIEQPAIRICNYQSGNATGQLLSGWATNWPQSNLMCNYREEKGIIHPCCSVEMCAACSAAVKQCGDSSIVTNAACWVWRAPYPWSLWSRLAAS